MRVMHGCLHVAVVVINLCRDYLLIIERKQKMRQGNV
jgi:hypothetical protein